MLGMGDYNYEHFTRDLLREWRLGAFSAPGPGEDAPDFTAKTLGGETVRLSRFKHQKNVVLVFGSVTCPMTAASIGGVNELYEHFRGDDFEFIFVYVREAHHGERIPAHVSTSDKTAASWLLRKEEDIEMPLVVDSLRGSIHRKYGKLPNSAFIIDKSGRIAFRAAWANPERLASALEELREVQHEGGMEHSVVCGGQDLTMPVSYTSLQAFRALERGGKEAIHDFESAIGTRRGAAVAESILEHPGRALAVIALSGAVLAGGLYAGFELRKRRLGAPRNPYRAYEKKKVRETDADTDYGAVGI